MKNNECRFGKNTLAPCSSFLVFSLALFFSLALTAQRDQSWANGIGPNITSSGDQTAGYVFTLSDIPDNVDTFGVSQGYHYFWFFDDGTYSEGSIPPSSIGYDPYPLTLASDIKIKWDTTVGNYVNDTIGSHVFLVKSPTGPNNVFLELTPRYDNKDKPKLFFLDTGLSPTPLANVTPVSSQDFLKISSFSDPVSGDTITYVIKYGTCDARGDLSFGFPSSIAQIAVDGIFTYKGEQALDASNGNISHATAIAQANNGQGLKLNLPTSTDTGTVFIRIKINDTGTAGYTIESTAEIEYENENEGCSVLADTVSYTIRAKSHDPNHIFSISKMCLPPPSKMTYTIVFQNIGNGDAENVMVRNPIPLDFDPATLKTIDPPGIVPNYDPAKRTYTWNMNMADFLKDGNPLKGTADPNYRTHFSENATMDSIVYEIEFYPDSILALKPCEMIATQAEIIFDCNKSIFTNVFKTEFMCCKDSCEQCAVYENIQKRTSKGETLSIGFAGNNNAGWNSSGNWYPPASISDIKDPNPNVLADDIPLIIYSSVNGCTRAEMLYPIKMADKNPVSGLVAHEDSNYDDCRAKIIVRCGNPPYKYSWEYVKGGPLNTLYSSANALNLKGVTYARVTVTDASGNTVVIHPQLNCPRKTRIIRQY